MFEYLRKVNYYETDKMGITHHSNYIRWMEEARMAFMQSLGYGYALCEQQGYICPVLSVACQYKTTTTFDDTVKISVTVKEYNGVRTKFGYTMTNVFDGKTVFVGETEHCFLDKNHRPVVPKKTMPALDAIFKTLLQTN